jgi:hypothetical protein
MFNVCILQMVQSGSHVFTDEGGENPKMKCRLTAGRLNLSGDYLLIVIICCVIIVELSFIVVFGSLEGFICSDIGQMAKLSMGMVKGRRRKG